MPPTRLDPYAELGLAPTATRRQIADAYRRLAKRYHPDLHREPAAGERMRRINMAWEVLSDPARRSRHDADARSAAAFRTAGGHWAPRYDARSQATWRPAGGPSVRVRRPARPAPAEPEFGDNRWVSLGVGALLALVFFVGTYLGSVSQTLP